MADDGTLGVDRRTVGSGGASTASCAAGGQSWPSLARHARGAAWCAVGVGHGSAVAGVAGEVPAVPDLPSSLSTAVRSSKLEEALRLLARHLRERSKLNLEEAFVDATFASAKRGLAVGPTRRGKGTKIVAVAAGNSLPLAVSVQSASPAECTLVEEVLAGSFLDELPARLIGDKAYDSDALDHKLEADYGIDLIAPNRRRRSKTQRWTRAAPLP